MRVTDSSSWFSNKQEQVSSLGLSSTCGPGLQGAPPYLEATLDTFGFPEDARLAAREGSFSAS